MVFLTGAAETGILVFSLEGRKMQVIRPPGFYIFVRVFLAGTGKQESVWYVFLLRIVFKNCGLLISIYIYS